MDLQPLFEVKERLEYAAIAGTSLLGEDFRLKRGLEGLKPLAAASPVFARIDTGLEGLLAAPQEQRAGLLLDVLALVDAVVYTQAKTGAEGDLSPLPIGNGEYLQLSYTQLAPLLEALTGTGGGRMNQLRDTYENHPEFFGDYRVLPVLVDHLGESYAELADLLFVIARDQGEAVIPLLKRNFDPAGKRDMTRRVQLMDAIAEGSENAWYLEQLPQAQKQVREALIFALRHRPGNCEKLMELCQTEKKDCLSAARQALACLDTAETLSYWRTLARQEPDTVLSCLRGVSTQTAACLTAELFDLKRYGPDFPLDVEGCVHISKLLFALDGKTGPEICQIYRGAAALGTALDREVVTERDGRKKIEQMAFRCSACSENRPFSRALPSTLLHSIQHTRDPGLCALADELYERHGELWAAGALCAALFTLDSKEAYRRGEEILQVKKHFFSRKKPVNRQAALRDVTWGLCWNKDSGMFEYVLSDTGSAAAGRIPGERSERSVLPYPLDPRWYDLLMEADGLDANGMDLIRPMEGPAGDRLRKYLSHKAVQCRDSQSFIRYTQALVTLGWTDWKDFWSKWVRTLGEADYYTARDILDRLPISGKEKAAQLREVNGLIRTKKLSARFGIWPDSQVGQMITQWENQ